MKFKSAKSARSAYESPKSVFDNRFVKVHWYNSDPNSSHPHQYSEDDYIAPSDESPMPAANLGLSPEEFEKRQAEADAAGIKDFVGGIENEVIACMEALRG